MKKFLILKIFIISISIYSQPVWIKINSPTNNTLRKIVFTDSLNGWACGLNGTIIHTSDGGENWYVQNTNTTNPIIDIYFLDNLTGWALSWEVNNPPYGTYLLKTSDGGLNWTSDFFPPEDEYFRAIFFLDEQFGLIGARQTYYTTDGGFSWNISLRDSDMVANFPFYQIKMLNDSVGFACGGVLDNAGIIWKTTNGGRNWKTNAISPDEIFEIYIFDSQNILALSGDPEYRFGVGLIKSSNGGDSWSYEELSINAVCYGIDFRNELEGWSAAGYKFLFTNDRGNSWAEMEAPDSSIVYDVQFVNNQKGFACGQDGVLLKYIPNPNSIQDESAINIINYQLFQNYPNPFNPGTKISWQSPVDNWQTLKVYDVLGNEVATLVNEYREAGRHKVWFDASLLASGIYIYKLRAGEFVSSKKMLLIK
ncbi:MAG: YCF48-related protein [Ignavibacterium sp.]